MSNKAGISARISGDPKPLKQAQDAALVDTQAWVNKMVGLNSSIQRSYNSLAFSGPQGRMKSPIAQLADEDAKAWARRMADTGKQSKAFGQALKSGAGDGLLQVAYAADDLQYGLRGVLNNIPGLLMSFGAKGGLAGVVTLAAMGVGLLGKKLWDLWVDAAKLKEVTAWVEQLNGKLKEAADARAKEALEGTAEGAEALAAAVESANEALATQQKEMQLAARNAQELASAQAALAESKVGGSSKEQVLAQQRIEVQLAKEKHAATMAEMKGEMDAHAARSKALDDFAAKSEAAAAQARSRAASIDPGADPFVRATEDSKAAAAAVDAQKARAEANKAHNDSLREQQRIAAEIAHREKVFALELQGIWSRTNKEIAATEAAAAEAAAAEKARIAEAAAAADEKTRREAAAAQEEKRRALEKQKDELERQIAARGGAAISDPGTAGDGVDRSRRINGRARPARAGFGVDDVRRYQQSSLRGEMDAAIGPVGNRRPTSATDKQAHQMRVQQANEGGDPVVTALREVNKQLGMIQKQTEGLTKTKSEPLTRS